MSIRNRGIIGVAIAATLGAAPAAQAQVALEVRGGLNVPTFKIADAVEAGPSFGAGLNYQLNDRVWLIADVDFGSHDGADIGAVTGPDVDVAHYIAKVGYRVNGAASRLAIVLNAGAGAMTFDVEGGESYTYPAINVGAKLIYALGSRASFVLSPQGDIAFGKEEEIGTSNAWVWPFAAGFRLNF